MKVSKQNDTGLVLVATLLTTAVLSLTSSLSLARSELPALGYRFVQNGNTHDSIHIMPAQMKAVADKLRVSGPALDQLLGELNREATETGWGCKNKIIEIISNPNYDSAKPLVVFEDEVTPAIVTCITK